MSSLKRSLAFLPLATLAAFSSISPAQPARAPDGESRIALASTLRQADARVGIVAYRLAVSGNTQCPESFPLTGMLFHHLAEYEPADQPIMIDLYGLDRGPGVLAVFSGTPAADAGLIAGDVLLAVNALPFPSPKAISSEANKKKRRTLIEESEAQLEEGLRQGPAELRILRKGRELVLTLGSVPGCLGRVRLARSGQVNAFANGRYVTMTTAMLDFVRNDDELALILGHELSHNILRHPAILDEQDVPKRGLLRAIGKNGARVWKTEEEADRLGIRLMWFAGYDVSAAIPFWKRLYRKFEILPQIFRTHPSMGARERIVREAIAALPVAPPAKPD